MNGFTVSNNPQLLVWPHHFKLQACPQPFLFALGDVFGHLIGADTAEKRNQQMLYENRQWFKNICIGNTKTMRLQGEMFQLYHSTVGWNDLSVNTNLKFNQFHYLLFIHDSRFCNIQILLTALFTSTDPKTSFTNTSNPIPILIDHQRCLS